jgi:hypothetical protein
MAIPAITAAHSAVHNFLTVLSMFCWLFLFEDLPLA